MYLENITMVCAWRAFAESVCVDVCRLYKKSSCVRRLHKNLDCVRHSYGNTVHDRHFSANIVHNREKCAVFTGKCVHYRHYCDIDVHDQTFLTGKRMASKKTKSVEKVSITCEKGSGKEVESMYINSGKVNYKKA